MSTPATSANPSTSAPTLMPLPLAALQYAFNGYYIRRAPWGPPPVTSTTSGGSTSAPSQVGSISGVIDAESDFYLSFTASVDEYGNVSGTASGYCSSGGHTETFSNVALTGYYNDEAQTLQLSLAGACDPATSGVLNVNLSGAATGPVSLNDSGWTTGIPITCEIADGLSASFSCSINSRYTGPTAGFSTAPTALTSTTLPLKWFSYSGGLWYVTDGNGTRVITCDDYTAEDMAALDWTLLGPACFGQSQATPSDCQCATIEELGSVPLFPVLNTSQGSPLNLQNPNSALGIAACNTPSTDCNCASNVPQPQVLNNAPVPSATITGEQFSHSPACIPTDVPTLVTLTLKVQITDPATTASQPWWVVPYVAGIPQTGAFINSNAAAQNLTVRVTGLPLSTFSILLRALLLGQQRTCTGNVTGSLPALCSSAMRLRIPPPRRRS